MNGWVSMIFSVLGGIALLMKSKTDENGGGFTVINSSDSANSSDSTDLIDAENVTVDDVIANPNLLDTLKVLSPEKYEYITRYIWQDPSARKKYVRSTDGWVTFTDKESEVMKILEEGILKPYYVGRSQSGEYFIEVFTNADKNVGWENGERVGMTQYAIILKTPDNQPQMIRDYELINIDADLLYDAWIARFNSKYAQL